MSRGGRIGIAVVVAVVAFGGAFLLFRGGGDSGSGDARSTGDKKCRDAAADTAYTASVEGAPTSGGKAVTIAVVRDGQPVTGAKVCMQTIMEGMGMGVTGTAKETSPGRYQVETDLGMPGKLSGTVVIEEPGRPAGSVPITIEVV